jgi:serine/threonine protein kinase
MIDWNRDVIPGATFPADYAYNLRRAQVMIVAIPCPRCGGLSKLSDGLCPTCLLQQTLDIAAEESTDGALSPDELTDLLAPAQGPGEIGRLGPYRVLEVVGRGGMGVVFRAEDPSLERVVALKAMLPTLAARPHAKKRFLREAKIAASIKHDHIVTIYQVGEDRGAPFLAMEFLQGEPLDRRLKREGKLPVREVLRIGREVAAGLAAAHEQNLIHRDIKPANIWLESRGVVSGGVVSGGVVSGGVVSGKRADGSIHHSPLTTHPAV